MNSREERESKAQAEEHIKKTNDREKRRRPSPMENPKSQNSQKTKKSEPKSQPRTKHKRAISSGSNKSGPKMTKKPTSIPQPKQTHKGNLVKPQISEIKRPNSRSQMKTT
ncbi:hypothetical protein TorRG33x02_012670 [Trema orientale]|uniref:Uncharacterized protein n=1 Tax=Trema orientale TaxID=63057 RepID=A0A2P5FZI7_TREOI|nr:hypothetical protein TorRG33x02_012670 [Trema orientale]